MHKFKILIVGGTWTTTESQDVKHQSYSFENNGELPATHNSLFGAASGLVHQIQDAVINYADTINVYNGGNYADLENILNSAKNYDIVFWWPNVDNSLPKVRNVKEVAPYVMLVTSKRNDNDKYSFQELNQMALAAKANLLFEFSKTDPIEFSSSNSAGHFNIRVFDPLGCEWFNGTDVAAAVESAMNRLMYLASITRQKTTQSATSKQLVMSWYFDQFKQNEYQSEAIVKIPDEQDFVDAVRKYAHKFQAFMPSDCKTERFIGNASLRPPQIGRCGKGMPSFRKGEYVFVSKRNIDKQFIELDNFVPVYLEDDKLYYCGQDKPSVDTPVQVKLYQTLPQINYIIHSHCYIVDAPFTETAIPCGAIEEHEEVMNTLQQYYGSPDADFYTLNLKGHGSLLMFHDMTQFHAKIEPNLQYTARTLPEIMAPSRTFAHKEKER